MLTQDSETTGLRIPYRQAFILARTHEACSAYEQT